MRNYKGKDNAVEEFEKEVLSKICLECRAGTYSPHPEQPEKYVKCCLCGHCREIEPRETLKKHKLF
jgi:hypothetical protein